MATTALILHRVRDYDTWRATYDSLEDLRARHGVAAAEVLAPLDGEDLVAVTHDFETPQVAGAYLGSGEVKSAMERAGVDVGSVEVHLLRRD